MDELRFVFQVETMSFKARYLAPEDALVVGHATLSRMDEARAHTPQDRQARLDALALRLKLHTERLAVLTRPEPKVAPQPVEPSADLLRLASREALLDLRQTNYLVDAYVNSVERALSVELVGPQDDSRVLSARVLYEAWFGQGRGFLQATHQRQWLAVHQRFHAPTVEQQAHLQALNLSERVAHLDALNEHFGRALGVRQNLFEGVPSEEGGQDAAVLADLLDALCALLVFACDAWPEPADHVHRARLSGPYVEQVAKRAGQYAAQRRAALEPSQG